MTKRNRVNKPGAKWSWSDVEEDGGTWGNVAAGQVNWYKIERDREDDTKLSWGKMERDMRQGGASCEVE
jgi:hypothetical protein